MTISMTYKVRKSFKYNGKTLNSGDKWVPEGGKFDQQIKNHLVVLVEEAPPPPPKSPAPRKRAPRKATNGAK